MKYKIYSLLLIFGGLALGWFTINATTSFAHFHIDWVCESGNELVTEKTKIDIVNRFNEHCVSAESKRKEIFSAVFMSSLFSGIYVLVLLFIGYKLYPTEESNGKL